VPLLSAAGRVPAVHQRAGVLGDHRDTHGSSPSSSLSPGERPELS
jgi:hypothetical protein